MPFTVNVGPYMGGQMIQQGLSNLGEGVAKAIEGYNKTRQEQEQDQVLLNFYQDQGLVTPDVMEQYQKGSHIAKTGIVAGLSRQYVATQQQKQEHRLQDEAQSMAAYRQQQIAASKAAMQQAQYEQNFTPRVFQAQTPPAGQTGIPYGPPTEAEAAAPKITMVEEKPGVFKEPQAPEGGFTAGPPTEVKNPTTGEVEGFTQPISKGSVQFVPTRTAPILDANGNLIGYSHGKSVIKPTNGKEWTPIQVEHAFKNFNVSASDVANSKATHALDIHGEETSNPDEVVSYAIDTDHGKQYMPKDSFEGLKDAVSGSDSLFNRHKQVIQQQQARQGAAAPAAAPAANEVVRVTSDGRRAVFDANTKKFLRFAE